jgi:hypothetical protein
VLLSIQKVLQKSTGSSGLLLGSGRAIVLFKKVALNFPPLEQGPAGKLGRRHLLLAFCAVQKRSAGALENR